jgi:uncharacterized protein YoxC
MMIEIAALVAAGAFAVLAAYLVATLVQIRKTAARAEELLAQLNAELPPVLQEVRAATANVNVLAEDARDGVQHASVFLHAVGDLGDTVQHVRGLVQGRGGSLIGNLTSVVAGIKAATAVVKDRLRREGGDPNGRKRSRG